MRGVSNISLKNCGNIKANRFYILSQFHWANQFLRQLHLLHYYMERCLGGCHTKTINKDHSLFSNKSQYATLRIRQHLKNAKKRVVHCINALVSLLSHCGIWLVIVITGQPFWRWQKLVLYHCPCSKTTWTFKSYFCGLVVCTSYSE